MSNTAAITNEDLMSIMQDMMQTTHDGFERLEQRMDSLEGRMATIEQRLTALEQQVRDNTVQITELREIVMDLVGKHAAYINDITDILDRIEALENRKPEITRAEFNELQKLLYAVVDWAKKIAKQSKVPLHLPGK